MVNWLDWFKKTKKYSSYEEQLKEVISDIKDLGQTFLDVGCGEGRFIRALTSIGKTVDGMDWHYNNFDIVKDKWPDKKYDVVFANLVLITLNKEEVDKVCQNMIAHSVKYVYVFDELRPNLDCCAKVDEGKWKHDPINHISLNEIYRKNSSVNSLWSRCLYQK